MHHDIQFIRDELIAIPERLEAQGEVISKLKSDFNYLERLEKQLLASIKLRERAYSKSMAEAETKAYASNEYKNHIEGIRYVEEELIKAEASREKLRTFFEGYRSIISSMKILA